MYPVDIAAAPQLANRNRLTVFFRLILAIPHLILAGGPVAVGMEIVSRQGQPQTVQWGAQAGVLGAVAGVCAIIGWFAIVFGASFPAGLQSLALFWLRWHVRASAYVAMLRDEYPPFGDADYPFALRIEPVPAVRNRVSVAFRPILVIPHVVVLMFLWFGWCISSLVAWFAIVFTGAYPAVLYDYAVGVLRWTTRVEAYTLLLTDEYPPFELESAAPMAHPA